MSLSKGSIPGQALATCYENYNWDRWWTEPPWTLLKIMFIINRVHQQRNITHRDDLIEIVKRRSICVKSMATKSLAVFEIPGVTDPFGLDRFHFWVAVTRHQGLTHSEPHTLRRRFLLKVEFRILVMGTMRTTAYSLRNQIGILSREASKFFFLIFWHGPVT